MGDQAPLSGPDLAQGVALADVPAGGSLLGHAGGEAVLLVRPDGGDDVFAIGATCSHYGGPLAEGCVVGREVRCPWHHARFDVTTGDAVGPPALSSLPCWRITRDGGRVVLAERLARAPRPAAEGGPASVVIVGAGAAGAAAAEHLRELGYRGPVTLVGGDPAPPVDRPNLSKDYLAGNAPEEWVTLRDEAFYREREIELLLGVRATALDVGARVVALSDGSTRPYGALLLATGAEPVRLPALGDGALYLRTLADSRAIIARAAGAKRAVVVGASFIGLEVAASLRTRGLEVDVVAPEAAPLAKVLGPELGAFVRALHEEHGVRFHLGRTVASVADGHAILDDGARLPADLVVGGVGVRPATALAEAAGLTVERGVVVDRFLATSAPGVWAAGDLARYPDPYGGAPVRIEHWATAEQQGQAAARNMLGLAQPFTRAPFFWSAHYDVTISYVGHAERWDAIEIAGDLGAKDALVAYRDGDRIVAVATVGRDRASLAAEAAIERGDQAALEALLTRGA